MPINRYLSVGTSSFLFYLILTKGTNIDSDALGLGKTTLTILAGSFSLLTVVMFFVPRRLPFWRASILVVNGGFVFYCTIFGSFFSEHHDLTTSELVLFSLSLLSIAMGLMVLQDMLQNR